MTTLALEKTCAGCRHELTSVGIRELRIGGHEGVWTAMFGGLAEASEGLLRVALYACVACGRLEMFLPPTPTA